MTSRRTWDDQPEFLENSKVLCEFYCEDRAWEIRITENGPTAGGESAIELRYHLSAGTLFRSETQSYSSADKLLREMGRFLERARLQQKHSKAEDRRRRSGS